MIKGRRAREHVAWPSLCPSSLKDTDLLESAAVLWLVMCAWGANHVQIFWERTNKLC